MKEYMKTILQGLLYYIKETFYNKTETDEKISNSIGKKANQIDLDNHVQDAIIHITENERNVWNNIEEKANTYTNEQISNITYSWENLENKPFDKTSYTNILIDHTDIIGELNTGYYRYTSGELLPNLNPNASLIPEKYLIPGNTYTVELNDKKYQAIAQEVPNAGGVIGLGNTSVFMTSPTNATLDPNAPFCVFATPGYTMFGWHESAIASNTVTLTVYEEVIDIIFLDKDVIPKVFMSKENPVGTGSFSLNRKIDTNIGNYSVATGYDVIATGFASHAEGGNTTASGDYAHAEGNYTTASGYYSHAEGSGTQATKSKAHAEGSGSKAFGESSHAEGNYTEASGYTAHAEGNYTVAQGDYSHAEGNQTQALKNNAHAEGSFTIANGVSSHAEGESSQALASYTHVEGYYNVAIGEAQHVHGKYNQPNPNYAHIVGNGTSTSARSNAYTLDWDGNAWFAGNIYVGGTSQQDGSKLALESSLDNYYLKTEADNLHTEVLEYVDTEIAALVNAAPETLDTIGELAAAFKENQDMVVTLNEAITYKQDKITDSLILTDAITGSLYTIQIQNGQLVSFPVERR